MFYCYWGDGSHLIRIGYLICQALRFLYDDKIFKPEKKHKVEEVLGSAYGNQIETTASVETIEKEKAYQISKICTFELKIFETTFKFVFRANCCDDGYACKSNKIDGSMGSHSLCCCDACQYFDTVSFNYCVYKKTNLRTYDSYVSNEINHDNRTVETLLNESAAAYKLSKNQISTFSRLFENEKYNLSSKLLNLQKPLENIPVFFSGHLDLIQKQLKEMAVFLGAKVITEPAKAKYIFTTVKALKNEDEKDKKDLKMDEKDSKKDNKKDNNKKDMKDSKKKKPTISKEYPQKCFSDRFLLSLLFKQTTVTKDHFFKITKDTEIKEKVCKCFIDGTHDGSNGIPTFFIYLRIFLVDEHGEEKGDWYFNNVIANIRKYMDNLHCWRGFIFCLLLFLLGQTKNNKQKKNKKEKQVVYLKKEPFLKSLKEIIGRRSVKALNGNTTRATLFASEIVIIPHLCLNKPKEIISKFFNCLKELCAISYFTKKYQECSKIRAR